MKTFILKLLFVLLMSIIIQGCLKKEFEDVEAKRDETPDYSGFDFSNINTIKLTLIVLNNNNEPITGAPFEVFTKDPLTSDGLLIEEANKFKILKGVTNDEGILESLFNYSPQYDSIYILSNYIGIPRLTSRKITSEELNITIGGSELKSLKNSSLKATVPDQVSIVNGYYILGDWDNNGVPNYLEVVNDNIDNSFLDEINASLPENIKLDVSHPQYLDNSNDANLIVSKDCEVWVTFVHEGAGWRNSLGYYTYPVGDAPSSANDIRDKTIIFPNVSYSGSGGGLSSGNKVQLFYLDPETQEYSKIFPANTSIGWFIVAQGWNGQIGNGAYTHYSDIAFNAEAQYELKKHNVLLFDETRELLLMGFEDIRRDQASDEDFNDAVFYTTITPFTAVNTSFYQPIDTPIDSDGDGVTDTFDEFPFDDTKAFKNHYPGENIYGTLIYEDLWPYKGDYDFNDLVIDYNFNQLTNSNNEISGIETKIVVKAIGASYHNGFGIQFNIPTNNVNSVTGQRLTQGFVNNNSNGSESNQTNATVIIFDDAFNNLSYPGVGIGVNTSPETPYVVPDTQVVNISFNSPVSFTELGTPPYNPFMIINRDRSVEVHLPNKKPTDLADLNLLGTGDDDSNVSLGAYYVSDYYLPWAINLPVSFEYPYEKEDITEAYIQFNPWANSRGYNYMDWYIPYDFYINSSKIYKK
ncbi:LruC domain-containing protein [Plebeiibacterium sediminum]|uniref:LruC domain-containing protein n=1 Tax=Plebeiibacterium sediminum TaxID=2992112 RepID=A0AAE3M5A6_9BACT|nr:LruC domain-containing protein [Plebeiobacterium sediminum]MCW3787462.1 LruC domain-containing protein [Plebeiobacterium sediminum]